MKLKISTPLGRKIFGRTIRAFSSSFWVMVIAFALMRVTPGDPASARLGAGAEAEAIEALREQLGLNENPIKQFINYIRDLSQGDFGVSLVSGVPVSEIITKAFPLTLTYIAFSFLFAFLISIPIGVLIGWSNKASWVYSFRTLTSVVIATPNFFIAMVAILFFSVQRD